MSIRERIKNSKLRYILPIYKEIVFRFRKNNSIIDPDIELLSSGWRKFSYSIKEKNLPVKNKKRILFLTGYGLGTHYKILEPSIMMALKNEGHEILSLICAGALPACEMNIVGSNQPPADPAFLHGITRSANLNHCKFI